MKNKHEHENEHDVLILTKMTQREMFFEFLNKRISREEPIKPFNRTIEEYNITHQHIATSTAYRYLKEFTKSARYTQNA